jgi:hypothetical protein
VDLGNEKGQDFFLCYALKTMKGHTNFLNWAKNMVYIYTNSKLLQKQVNANPIAWYEKNMLFENLMFDVDESGGENKS